MNELAPEERQVLELLARGFDNRAIAAQLGMTSPAVTAHVRSIMDKLGARSRVEALARAYERGLVSRQES
jgi:DNA-binding NarL/FixJ family response regulator